MHTDRTFLASLEQLLAEGVASLPKRFVETQATLVRTQQAPDGGFTGRRGQSDVYYTAFGARLMELTGCQDASAWKRLDSFADTSCPVVTEPVDVLSLLECHRILNRHGAATSEIDENRLTACLRASRTGNGYALGQGAEFSVYQTFIVLLACELLGKRVPGLAQVADAVLARQTADGGFAESAPPAPSAVNPTCAALVVLSATLRGNTASLATILTTALSGRALRVRQAAERAFEFFVSLQGEDGGFRTHASAPCSDLLSTFTVLSVLSTADRLAAISIADTARYVRALALPAGGFRPSLLDSDTDVEYTYYGLGALAILARHAANRKPGRPTL